MSIEVWLSHQSCLLDLIWLQVRENTNWQLIKIEVPFISAKTKTKKKLWAGMMTHDVESHFLPLAQSSGDWIKVKRGKVHFPQVAHITLTYIQ